MHHSQSSSVPFIDMFLDTRLSCSSELSRPAQIGFTPDMVLLSPRKQGRLHTSLMRAAAAAADVLEKQVRHMQLWLYLPWLGCFQTPQFSTNLTIDAHDVQCTPCFRAGVAASSIPVLISGCTSGCAGAAAGAGRRRRLPAHQFPGGVGHGALVRRPPAIV